MKHAGATGVTIRLAQAAGALVPEVTDNGVGFDTARSFPGHLGLQSMRERVAYLGGTVDIDSAPGRGTSVRVRVPIQ